MNYLCISRGRHLKNAALVWIIVGLMLGIRGMLWMLRDPYTHKWIGLLLPLALLLGLFKGKVVLRKAALKTTQRITLFEDRTPFWQLYSPRTYFLILGMMVVGFLCRWAGAHWHVSGDIGVLYLVVSIALITGSRAYNSAFTGSTG